MAIKTNLSASTEVMVFTEISYIYISNIHLTSLNYRLHQPVSDWLETLPHRISGLNMYREIPIGHK